MGRKKMKQAKADWENQGRHPAHADDEIVVESCGCVFCDLDDIPEMINGALKHHYQGRNGRLVPCTKQQ